MSTPQALLHVQAVKAALAAAADPPLVVYLGGSPPAPAVLPDRFAVLHPDPGQAIVASLADDRVDFAGMVQVTCVGKMPEMALWVADRMREAFASPVGVPGRAMWRPEELGGPPLDRDDDLSPPMYFVAVQWRLRSTPA